MRSVFCIAATLLAAAGAYAQQNAFSINTPTNAVVCQPLLINWQGGSSPYFLSVLPGNDPNGQALESLGTISGTTFTWTVNIAAGTQVGLTLRDSSGQTAQSAAFTINPGSDTSCVGKAISGSAGSGSASTSGAASGSGSASTSTGAGAASGTTSGTTSAGSKTSTPTSAGGSASSTSTSTSGSTTKSNAASPANVAKVGVAGVAGAILAAFLA